MRERLIAAHVVHLGRQEVNVLRPRAVQARFHVRIDDVGRNAADLYHAVVLYEDGVARQVAVNDGRIAVVQVVQRSEQLNAPSFPCLPFYGLIGFLGLAQKLFQRTARHIFGDENDL